VLVGRDLPQIIFFLKSPHNHCLAAPDFADQAAKNIVPLPNNPRADATGAGLVLEVAERAILAHLIGGPTKYDASITLVRFAVVRGYSRPSASRAIDASSPNLACRLRHSFWNKIGFE
jgi:hypothetical protein